MLEVNPDAEAAVAAENQFNDPAPAGRQFVMATVELTYDGDEAQANVFEVNLTTVGDGNVEYSFGDTCGVIPDDIRENGDLFQGGTVTGNDCWAVATDDVGSLLLAAEPAITFDSDPVFFALR